MRSSAIGSAITPSWGHGLKDLQFPDISVTHNGHVYVTFRSIAASGQSTDAIYIVKSTNCGRTFSAPRRNSPEAASNSNSPNLMLEFTESP